MQLAASDKIEVFYGAKIEAQPDLKNSLTIKTVAVGQMPQGCLVTVDADSEAQEEVIVKPPV